MKFLNVSYNTRNIVVKMMYCTWNIKDFCKYLNISASHYILNHGNGHYILKNEIITMSLRRNNNSSPFICRIYDGSMKIAILTRYSRGIRSEQWLSRRRITVKAYLRRLPVYGPLTETLEHLDHTDSRALTEFWLYSVSRKHLSCDVALKTGEKERKW